MKVIARKSENDKASHCCQIAPAAEVPVTWSDQPGGAPIGWPGPIVTIVKGVADLESAAKFFIAVARQVEIG
jgi:hypothetical protein